jgi:two-component system response regulator MprA
MSLILVVDDHAATREPLAKLLRYDGYETAVASNGAEALEALRERKPDLVLLDLLMPKMDGMAFLDQAAREPHGSDLPVIVVTGGLNVSQIRRAGELPGVVDVMSKARFTVDGLLDRIRAHLAA